VAETTPRYLATFGPTVDYRSIVTDDLRRAMRHRGRQGSATRNGFANVSLLVGFAEGEAAATFSRQPQLHAADLADPRLSQLPTILVEGFFRNAQLTTTADPAW